METTWTVLRKFGYGEGLDLREDFLTPRWVTVHSVLVSVPLYRFVHRLPKIPDRTVCRVHSGFGCSETVILATPGECTFRGHQH